MGKIKFRNQTVLASDACDPSNSDEDEFYHILPNGLKMNCHIFEKSNCSYWLDENFSWESNFSPWS